MQKERGGGGERDRERRDNTKEGESRRSVPVELETKIA